MTRQIYIHAPLPLLRVRRDSSAAADMNPVNHVPQQKMTSSRYASGIVTRQSVPNGQALILSIVTPRITSHWLFTFFQKIMIVAMSTAARLKTVYVFFAS